MQETLDRMVASVRHGVMDAECGSRAIHECAALLGLQLASSIPGNTLIVSGMPKWVKKDDLLSAFSEFGEIEAAAVAANRRGFGEYSFDKGVCSLPHSRLLLNSLFASSPLFHRTGPFPVTEGSFCCNEQVSHWRDCGSGCGCHDQGAEIRR